ncbi:MAG: glycosyltransferase [Desulfovibrionaceae bacterium]|nr:glycosyltransferase [Desulfovibrionaceae bacterium]
MPRSSAPLPSSPSSAATISPSAPPPAVSVLLPAHNAAATLPRALDSLLAQTLADFEIVAVDDGSTDATGDVLAAYAARDGRVHPLAISHGGIVAALEAGRAACRGRYVARMDADDVSLPGRLAAHVAHLDARPDLGLSACRVRFGGDGAAGGYARYVRWTNTLLAPGAIAAARFRESPLAHPSVCFRAEVARVHGGYRDGDFPEDYELWLRWLDAGVRMEKLPEELLVWNDPPGRLSRTHPRYSVENFYRLKALWLARWLAAHNPHHPDVIVVGSGRTTRKRAELLTAHGVRIAAYVDVDPRKIGTVIHGRPVLSRAETPGPEAAFVLSYVASHGAGRDIAAFLRSLGFVEGVHFLLAA